MQRWVLQVAGYVLAHIGEQGRRWFARALGVLLFIFLTERRAIAYENLRYSFPEKSSRWIRRVALSSFINLAIVFTELLSTPYLGIEKIRKRFHFVNPDVVKSALDRGKGVVLVSAHIANWEWSALVAACEFNQPLLVVVKQQRNRGLNQWLDAVRQISGNELVVMNRAARRMIAQLSRGGIVALLGDQAAEPLSDVFVPLFGRPAATYKAPALLARRQRAHLIFGYCLRRRDGKYVVHFVPITAANDPTVAIEDVVAEYNRHLETVVRRAPEQWVWQHKRWKYEYPLAIE